MNRRFSAETIAELEFLSRYDLGSYQSGIKVHNDAPVDVIAAAKRLHEKGIINQQDGGYLTDRGIETAESLQRILKSVGDETFL
ncbi:MAG: TIGR02647 family protein [Motiliproteus sp.]